jgi:hypothetical protein
MILDTLYTFCLVIISIVPIVIIKVYVLLSIYVMLEFTKNFHFHLIQWIK